MDMLSNAGWNASESPEYGMLSLAASLFIHYILQFERREHLCSYAIRPHSSLNSSRRPSLIQRIPFLGVTGYGKRASTPLQPAQHRFRRKQWTNELAPI